MSQFIVLPTDNALTRPGKVVTRFAPSPNGYLHLGHAYAAICAHDFARAHGGEFLLRIEDIDGIRSLRTHRQAILTDMAWLELGWDRQIIYQSLRVARYLAALEKLKALNLVYRCTCSRSDIAAAIRQRSVAHGPDGPVYPGTCRNKAIDNDAPANWRIDMRAAIDYVFTRTRVPQLHWYDVSAGQQEGDPALFGDVVLWRKDAMASYHLASVVDDAADEITHVVRGVDLFAYTAVHVVLQKLLGLLQPAYWHHALLTGNGTEKLAKSRHSDTLEALRERGDSGAALAHDIRRGKLPLGISVLGS
jgi:glutamyl-Q tRNA(Asp) synthetase